MPTTAEQPTQPVAQAPEPVTEGQNLRHLVGWGRFGLRLLGAVASGLLLSAAFPPVEFALFAWIALVPILLVPPPPGVARRLALGYVFGFAFTLTTFFWLNEIGFGAGVLMALIVACFPMLWYVSFNALLDAWREERDDANPTPGLGGLRRPGRQIGAVLLGAASWVALEWIRSWIFTGFPWNFLGIALWQSTALLRLCAFTGVYGLSFLIVAVNLALAARIHDFGRAWRDGRRAGYSWPFVAVALLFLPVLAMRWTVSPLPDPDRVLRVLAVQGNIPQCREWTDEEFEESLEVYTSLTRDLAPTAQVDLVVWPETAVPAPLGYPPYWNAVRELQTYTKIPLLLGTVDHREAPSPEVNSEEPASLTFNSAILLDAEAKVVDHYDKIHRVPFGEYVPFSHYLPWLVELIGMGRDLTPGTEFTILHLRHGVRAGVNICFEDAFSEISRTFVKRGANVLVTITNDAWYGESSGARQHLLQAVFRAAETRRPLLRAGNNSETCLILPNGTITDPLRDPDTGSPFYRGGGVYEVPVWDNPPTTFHTRHGDLFAILCAIAAAIAGVLLFSRMCASRRALRIARLGDEAA
ncbi:MAG: apolipoprotein N-acyltransferase [Victivallales bacterium]|nr:apolipoprotein N-acyltransferase [Victivallales bacterium]